MTSEEAKKYCIEVIEMTESDFRKPEQEDLDIDGIDEKSWIHDFICHGPDVSEGDMKTAIELAEEYKFYKNPENLKKIDDWIDEQMAIK